MSAKFVVGIDLGTTHSALALAELSAADARVGVLEIEQLVSAGAVAKRALLPSFLYFAHASESALALPWDEQRRFAVGEFARSRGAETPQRVIASAKSWLSYGGIDRRAGNLPLGAPEDIEKISPVEVSFRYLDHLNEAFRAARPADGDLSEQEVVLTVPASFDAGARDLTVEAALAAGFEQVTLLEEPQAALYAWIEQNGEAWRSHLHAGDRVLVIDIGGGTTDFSLIDAVEQDGSLGLSRVAVGDHILLGGDNMDLALAHVVGQELAEQGKELDRFQLGALAHACRAAKEQLLSDASLEQVAVVLPSRGSQLLGGSIRGELRREQVERYLLDGFFPAVSANELPKVRPRAGLTQVGLPYASDAAITKHLAAFLARHAFAEPGTAADGATARPPTAILFNGGVLKAEVLRTRVIETLNGWLEQRGSAKARVLPGEDLDLAVARGAAYYGLVRHGRGLRIRGGTARAYYVGIESPMPALPGLEPPVFALCVAPFGMEEGSHAALPPQELFVVVGEPVTFRFFGSSTRRSDPAGTVLERWRTGELEELPQIELVLPPAGRAAGDVVAVQLQASVTAIGTLKLEAIAQAPIIADERWQIELSVRLGANGGA
ncbi:MAG TPA: Hsp70 family protein [Polyangiaceae bacterium]|nr:Hsp70 family protein [Polyangiaceae bacterium]